MTPRRESKSTRVERGGCVEVTGSDLYRKSAPRSGRVSYAREEGEARMWLEAVPGPESVLIWGDYTVGDSSPTVTSSTVAVQWKPAGQGRRAYLCCGNPECARPCWSLFATFGASAELRCSTCLGFVPPSKQTHRTERERVNGRREKARAELDWKQTPSGLKPKRRHGTHHSTFERQRDELRKLDDEYAVASDQTRREADRRARGAAMTAEKCEELFEQRFALSIQRRRAMYRHEDACARTVENVKPDGSRSVRQVKPNQSAQIGALRDACDAGTATLKLLTPVGCLPEDLERRMKVVALAEMIAEQLERDGHSEAAAELRELLKREILPTLGEFLGCDRQPA